MTELKLEHLYFETVCLSQMESFQFPEEIMVNFNENSSVKTFDIAYCC